MWAVAPSVVDANFDLATERTSARSEGLAETKPPVTLVSDVDAAGVPCRLYRPREGAPVIVHLHGGGFVFGDLETHDAHSRRLANATGWAVLSVDYRLAPEHPYPAACDDVDAVLGWLTAEGTSWGLDPERLGVLGDSAGGYLALIAARRRPVFRAAVLVYPCLDPSGAQPSYRTETGGLTAAEMDWYWNAFVPDPQLLAQVELSPLTADLGMLPPCLVITAEHDPLRDEGEALANAIARAGVRTVGTRCLGMIHGFYRHLELFDAGHAVMDQVVAFLQSSLETPSRRET